MSLFKKENEVFDPNLPKKSKFSVKKKLKSFEKQLLRKESAAKIIEEIGGLPEAGESVDIITNGQSNAGGFYEVIRDYWEEIEEMCLATWIINRFYIDMLFNDINTGKLKKLNFIISNRMSQLGHHKPNFNVLKEKFYNHSNINFRVKNSHAKTYALTNGKDFICIDGSGNWSENPRIENYTITNSKSKFDFKKMWMLEMCE